MRIMFATICDHCGFKTEEYGYLPSCRDCQDDICPTCAAPNTTTDDDLDDPATYECRSCWDAANGPNDEGILDDAHGDDRS